MENLARRKQIELEEKIKSLENELTSWEQRSKPHEKFEKHHTQIRAVKGLLHGWHAKIQSMLNFYNAEEDPDAYLGECLNAEKLILSEHRIWDYFRSKFVQRNESSFNLYLQAADEFAWACYFPVQTTVYPDVADAQRKEPPLVFFNGGLSPFSVSRDRFFQYEMVAGEGLNIPSKDVINKLPIPVIGIPWHQISYLPQVLIIGHEVGHLVEDDFGLTGRLKELLDEGLREAKAETRKEAWHSWLGEIFADLYGCLAAGPAFAGTLIDFLAKDREKVVSEDRTPPKWGRYPTDYIRMLIVLKALEIMGFEAETEDYRTFWANYKSEKHAEFIADVVYVIPKLLQGEHPVLRGQSIQKVFSFTRNQQTNVESIVNVLGRIAPNIQVPIPSTDIRILFAAVRTAFEKSPAQFVSNKLNQAVLAHIEKKVLTLGVRSGEVRLSEQQLSKKVALQEQSGVDLMEQLLHSETEK